MKRKLCLPKDSDGSWEKVKKIVLNKLESTADVLTRNSEEEIKIRGI